jgi:hypothetical protein
MNAKPNLAILLAETTLIVSLNQNRSRNGNYASETKSGKRSRTCLLTPYDGTKELINFKVLRSKEIQVMILKSGKSNLLQWISTSSFLLQETFLYGCKSQVTKYINQTQIESSFPQNHQTVRLL